MSPGDSTDAGRLQRLIIAEFALAAHMGVVVEAAGAAGVVLRAPLSANANHQGTAFGGSLFSLAALAGWAWLVGYLAQQRIEAEAVIQESTIRYLAPVVGELRAALAAPSAERIAHFDMMMRRAGRGRIGLEALLYDGTTVAAKFDGVFAAALRRA